MNILTLVKIGGGVAVVIAAYFFGYSHGQNIEELNNARLEISSLERTVQEFKAKQTSDAVALAELRVAESASRNELDRMRGQFAAIERMSKTDADRERNRCLKLAIRGKELLDRAEQAIRFCEKNHK
ncbi:hypothetical protein [uncultured Parasutterella sp.]|uniref:hypothetical protein n=1 Tax=uncultured Parasutterella sp. TaxID=1263098 RepID=UPI00272BC1AD|nr:hypothetical protein [uncultured Parasutterella sp.]